MSKLEDLVPPLELCKMIPEGKFADSWFVRPDQVCGDPIWTRGTRHYYRMDACGIKMFPAPTLQEILNTLSEIGEPVTLTQWKTGQIAVSCQIGDDSFEEVSQNGATTALKIWLEIYGEDAR